MVSSYQVMMPVLAWSPEYRGERQLMSVIHGSQAYCIASRCLSTYDPTTVVDIDFWVLPSGVI